MHKDTHSERDRHRVSERESENWRARDWWGERMCTEVISYIAVEARKECEEWEKRNADLVVLLCSIQEMLTGQRLCHSESHNDSVLAALNQQRSDGILCDVTLIAEEQKFHAHKAVLAACSDYFRAMFSLCMVESGADEVNLHGVTSLGLKQALEFAYTGQIRVAKLCVQHQDYLKLNGCPLQCPQVQPCSDALQKASPLTASFTTQGA
ncbi:Kelch-like protein 32 [Galemys pyrenaicus]|uniref:Kelch-like protein 32 n=1 Tax=Galemys pyrenaicus TaxID=202257 RepID=A0A8J6ANF3_GALPY|nr:Kelch-like protein 32 [Galemys pyrenaicus]